MFFSAQSLSHLVVIGILLDLCLKYRVFSSHPKAVKTQVKLHLKNTTLKHDFFFHL